MSRWLFILTFLFTVGCSSINKDYNVDIKKYHYILKIRVVTKVLHINDQQYIVDYDKAYDILKRSERYFSDLKIKFVISSYQPTEIEFDVGIDDIKKDAAKYPNELSIYFMDFTPAIQSSIGMGDMFVSGFAAFPWENNPHAIMLFDYQSYDACTIAHEIGHIFGLLHTFDEDDFVNDTPPGKNFNYPNVMNYYTGPDVQLTFTPGQIKRMEFFISSHRQYYFER